MGRVLFVVMIALSFGCSSTPPLVGVQTKATIASMLKRARVAHKNMQHQRAMYLYDRTIEMANAEFSAIRLIQSDDISISWRALIHERRMVYLEFNASKHVLYATELLLHESGTSEQFERLLNAYKSLGMDRDVDVLLHYPVFSKGAELSKMRAVLKARERHSAKARQNRARMWFSCAIKASMCTHMIDLPVEFVHRFLFKRGQQDVFMVNRRISDYQLVEAALKQGHTNQALWFAIMVLQSGWGRWGRYLKFGNTQFNTTLQEWFTSSLGASPSNLYNQQHLKQLAQHYHRAVSMQKTPPRRYKWLTAQYRISKKDERMLFNRPQLLFQTLDEMIRHGQVYAASEVFSRYRHATGAKKTLMSLQYELRFRVLLKQTMLIKPAFENVIRVLESVSHRSPHRGAQDVFLLTSALYSQQPRLIARAAEMVDRRKQFAVTPELVMAHHVAHQHQRLSRLLTSWAVQSPQPELLDEVAVRYMERYPNRLDARFYQVYQTTARLVLSRGHSQHRLAQKHAVKGWLRLCAAYQCLADVQRHVTSLMRPRTNAERLVFFRLLYQNGQEVGLERWSLSMMESLLTHYPSGSMRQDVLRVAIEHWRKRPHLKRTKTASRLWSLFVLSDPKDQAMLEQEVLAMASIQGSCEQIEPWLKTHKRIVEVRRAAVLLCLVAGRPDVALHLASRSRQPVELFIELGVWIDGSTLNPPGLAAGVRHIFTATRSR